MIKDEVAGIVGKTIAGVVIKLGSAPTARLYLLFDDDTYYEFYSEGMIRTTGGPGPGAIDEVRNRGSERHFIALEATAPPA